MRRHASLRSAFANLTHQQPKKRQGKTKMDGFDHAEDFRVEQCLCCSGAVPRDLQSVVTITPRPQAKDTTTQVATVQCVRFAEAREPGRAVNSIFYAKICQKQAILSPILRAKFHQNRRGY